MMDQVDLRRAAGALSVCGRKPSAVLASRAQASSRSANVRTWLRAKRIDGTLMPTAKTGAPRASKIGAPRPQTPSRHSSRFSA